MKKTSVTLAVVLLVLVAVIHLLRFFAGWEVTVNGTMIPLWASLVAFAVSGGIGLMLWRDTKK